VSKSSVSKKSCLHLLDLLNPEAIVRPPLGKDHTFCFNFMSGSDAGAGPFGTKDHGGIQGSVVEADFIGLNKKGPHLGLFIHRAPFLFFPG